jgi:SAM-dependent methyltransferase
LVPPHLYDEVRYTTWPRLETHPDRLAALGRLFGMDPAPVERCRVLEIGCGDGGNLIPMAYALPGSRFTGVDLAPGAIAQARAAARALRLRNLELRASDLREIGEPAGEFDYILAHGVYSWVPAEVRDRLLAVCRERLAPHGIAFVSYNALPGGHVRQMLREMLLYRLRSVAEPGERLLRAREYLRFLLERRMLTEPWQPLFDSEVRGLLERSDDGLFHDDLAPVNFALPFHEFASHAARHSLQYLGEAELHQMFLGHALPCPDDARDIVEREQHLDFLKARRFRQTLLCRREISLERNLRPEQMASFLFSASFRQRPEGRIEGLHGVLIAAGPEVESVARALGELYPLPLEFSDLVPYAGSAAAAAEILFHLVTAGFANLHVYPFPCAEEIGLRPRASALARRQAAVQNRVTNLCHQSVELPDAARALVRLLDGRRTAPTLARAVAAQTGIALQQVRDGLPATLEWMAQMALLEA